MKGNHNTAIRKENEMKIYQKLAGLVNARNIGSLKDGTHQKDPWYITHTNNIQTIVRETSPTGSGIDTGTTLDLPDTWVKHPINRLVFRFSFHHMNEHGMYDGWTDHKLTVTPSLVDGFDLNISGRDKNQIKDHLYDTFNDWLQTEYENDWPFEP